MLRRLHELAQDREDLAFESTLAGRTIQLLMAELLSVGYDIHIFYLWLPSPDLAVGRVRRRVETGGHDVPEAVIRRRFWKSLINFDRLYRPASTTWRIYDSSFPDGRTLIARGMGTGIPVVLDANLWQEIRRRIEEAG